MPISPWTKAERPIDRIGRLVVGIVVALFAYAADASAQDLIRVHVVPPTAEGGFVDDTLKGQQDSFADLTERLRKSKTLTVVDDPAVADVTLEIRGRGWKATSITGDVITEKDVVLSPAARDLRKEVTIVLKAGTYEKALSAQNSQVFGAWKAIAGRLASDVEKWVKDNRTQLLSRRTAN